MKLKFTQYKSLINIVTNKHRHRSRINTDRLPTRAPRAQGSKGVRGHAAPINFLGFWIIQTGYWRIPFSWDKARIKPCKSADYFTSRFQLGEFYIYIYIYIYIYTLKIYLLRPISVKRWNRYGSAPGLYRWQKRSSSTDDNRKTF